MSTYNTRGFLSGMLLGLVLSLTTGAVALFLLMVLDIVAISVIETPSLQLAGKWMQSNLGLSVLPFGITLALYIYSLRALARRLADNAPQNEVAQLEHLIDVWTSLFFGIGVIWTAIGMRSALLHAIGDPSVAAQSGAFEILARLVDGGILTALTTTIVGGIGGYLMRVIKSLHLGMQLNLYYENLEQHHAERVELLLGDIKESLVGHTGRRSATTFELIEDS
jgi:hypothetical protein